MAIDLGPLRATANNVLVDECVVTRAVAAGRTVDPVTLAVVAPADVTVYDGTCSVRQLAAGGTTSAGTRDDGDGAQRMVETWQVLLPATATGIRPGDAVTVTVCHGDPDVEGAVMAVESVVKRSYAVLRRLRCTRRVPADGVPV